MIFEIFHIILLSFKYMSIIYLYYYCLYSKFCSNVYTNLFRE